MKVLVNVLTLLRVLATFLLPVVWKLFSPSKILIFVICILLTDFFDGFLARKFNVSTLLGSILDCFADKLFGIAIILVIATYYKSFYIVLLMELLIASINVIAAFRGAKTASSMLGRAKMWVLGLAIVISMISIFKYNLMSFIHVDLLNTWLRTFIEYESIIVLFGSSITVGAQMMVAIDYLVRIIKELKDNNKKIKYDFKSNKELKYVLLDHEYYVNNKNKPLSWHFLKNN